MAAQGHAASPNLKLPPLGMAILVTSIPLFMAMLDNLVVVFALPVIRTHLHGSQESMEWIVNSYTLAYSAMMLTAAALGDRFGRKLFFVIGIFTFTAASATCALSTSTGMLIAARAVQGAGAAAILPLSLTLLAAAVPPNMRNLAIGVWGGVSGMGIAAGPVVSGAVVDGLNWQWIFWLNVPLGVMAIPLVWMTLRESRGPDRELDPLGLVLAAGGVFALVWGIIRSNSHGWTSTQTLSALIGGGVLMLLFLVWQNRAPKPLLPLRLFRYRSFTIINASAFLFSIGVFGTVFLLAQYFAVVEKLSALQAGLDTLPWTAAPMVAAPLAGALMTKIGSRVIVFLGMSFQSIGLAWIALTTGVNIPYSTFVPSFILAGIGLGLTVAPISTVVLTAVPDKDHAKAAGANSTLRELGVALGIAVMGAIFAAKGGYASGSNFVDGLRPALWAGCAIVGFGAVLALMLPGRKSEFEILARMSDTNAAALQKAEAVSR